MIWYCKQCGWNANIITFKNRIDGTELQAPRFLCLSCGMQGRITDDDRPSILTEEEADRYWYELQNIPNWQPPNNTLPCLWRCND